MKKKEEIAVSQIKLNDLFFKMQKGEQTARAEIISQTYGLVYFCVKKYLNQNVEFEELVSVGAMCLVKAVDNYQIERKINFTTYATRCIHNGLLNLMRKYNREIEKNTISTSTPLVEDESRTVEELLLSSENIEEDYCDKRQIEDLLKLVYKLPELEKFIILNYYGFENLERLNTKQIGAIIGHSQSYTSRAMAKIHETLKKQLSELGYESNTYARTRK